LEHWLLSLLILKWMGYYLGLFSCLCTNIYTWCNWHNENGTCTGIAATVQIKPINHKSETLQKSEKIDSKNRSLSGRRDATSRHKDSTRDIILTFQTSISSYLCIATVHLTSEVSTTPIPCRAFTNFLFRWTECILQESICSWQFQQIHTILSHIPHYHTSIPITAQMYLPFKIEIAQVQALECHVAELHAKTKLL
jgi:hypothetical protein